MGKFTKAETTSLNRWDEWTFLSENGESYLVTTHTEFYPAMDYNEFTIEEIKDELGGDLDPEDLDRVREELEDVDWEVEPQETEKEVSA